MAGSSIVRAPVDAVGKEARRALRAGDLIRDERFEASNPRRQGRDRHDGVRDGGHTLDCDAARRLPKAGSAIPSPCSIPRRIARSSPSVIAPGTVRVNSQTARPLGPTKWLNSQP